MRRQIRTLIAAASVLTVIGALTACSESGGGTDENTYKIGVGMALSGSNAALGQDFVRFMEYAVEDVNEQYKDDGFTVELVIEDTQATAEVGLNALNKMVSVEGVPIILTAWSGVVKAMASAAEDTGTAIINVGANSPELEGAGKNLRNFFPLASVDVRGIANYIYGQGAKTAGIIAVNNVTGEGAAKVYKDTFEANGGEVVASETIEQDAVDASSQVAKVLAANPDTVHVHPLLGEASSIFKALQAQGFTGPVTTYSLAQTTAMRDASGDAMTGLLYSTLETADPNSPEVSSLVDKYLKDYGTEPAGIAYDIFMYDSIFWYAEVIKQLRAEDKEVTGENILGLIDDVKTFDNLPLQGSTTFTDNGTVVKDVVIREIKDPSDSPANDPAVATVPGE